MKWQYHKNNGAVNTAYQIFHKNKIEKKLSMVQMSLA